MPQVMQPVEQVITKKRGKMALAEIGRVASPEAMLESLCEEGIDMKWAVRSLKGIADNGGKMAQIEAVRSLVAMMIDCHIASTNTVPFPEDPTRPSRRIDAVIEQARTNAENKEPDQEPETTE